MRFPVLAAGAALTLMLGGCGTDPDPIWAQSFGFVCANHNNPACRARAPESELVSRYCYKSLADANCFDQPAVMSPNQELGSSGK